VIEVRRTARGRGQFFMSSRGRFRMSLDTPACAGSALAAPGPMSTDVVDRQRRREQHRVIDALARKTHGHRIALTKN
jgi:hypothetical protein